MGFICSVEGRWQEFCWYRPSPDRAGRLRPAGAAGRPVPQMNHTRRRPSPDGPTGHRLFKFPKAGRQPTPSMSALPAPGHNRTLIMRMLKQRAPKPRSRAGGAHLG